MYVYNKQHDFFLEQQIWQPTKLACPSWLLPSKEFRKDLASAIKIKHSILNIVYDEHRIQHLPVNYWQFLDTWLSNNCWCHYTLYNDNIYEFVKLNWVIWSPKPHPRNQVWHKLSQSNCHRI